MNLQEYAAKNPGEPIAKEQSEMKELARSVSDAREDREEAERLKDVIGLQIEKGQEPQTILYTALKCIGLLTNSQEWAESGHAALEAVYQDIAQQSFLVDQSAIEIERLNRKEEDYRQKLLKNMERQLRNCQKIDRDITSVIRSLNEISREESEE